MACDRRHGGMHDAGVERVRRWKRRRCHSDANASFVHVDSNRDIGVSYSVDYIDLDREVKAAHSIH